MNSMNTGTSEQRALRPADKMDSAHENSSGVAPWAVSIYSSRETWPELQATLTHAEVAARGRTSVLDLVINGNKALAELAARHVDSDLLEPQGRQLACRKRVWFVTLGDKAHAWNQYVTDIAPPAKTYFFVDGYARVDAQSFACIDATLAMAPQALAASGIPRSGWSARSLAARLRREGGLHGNLYALGAPAMQELRGLGFRLPLGLYRTDSTLGAALAFGLNLHERAWRPHDRIALSEQASWSITSLRWWSPQDWRTNLRRVARQGQGALENAAVREHFAIRGEPFHTLPATALALVAAWMRGSPSAAAELLAKNAAARRAWAQLQVPRDWNAASKPPQLLVDSH